MSNILTPFVYWAQTENQITLKVDLTNVKVYTFNQHKHIFFLNFINITYCMFCKYNASKYQNGQDIQCFYTNLIYIYIFFIHFDLYILILISVFYFLYRILMLI
jgi:hypothetical protein